MNCFMSVDLLALGSPIRLISAMSLRGILNKSATFSKKAQAKTWGQKVESEVLNGRYYSRQEDKERPF